MNKEKIEELINYHTEILLKSCSIASVSKVKEIIKNKEKLGLDIINMKTGKREWNSEVSIIDTMIFISGAIFAGEYFGENISKKANQLY